MSDFDSQTAGLPERLTAGLDRLSRRVGRHGRALIGVGTKPVTGARPKVALPRADSVAQQERITA